MQVMWLIVNKNVLMLKKEFACLYLLIIDAIVTLDILELALQFLVGQLLKSRRLLVPTILRSGET